MDDIIEIKGEIGRIKNHLDLIKKSGESQNKSLSNIENTLIGNNLNGNKGIVFLLNDIDSRVKNLETNDLERRQTETNAKWIGGFIITFFFILITYVIQHLPKV
jgi:hypothetical protein